MSSQGNLNRCSMWTHSPGARGADKVSCLYKPPVWTGAHLLHSLHSSRQCKWILLPGLHQHAVQHTTETTPITTNKAKRQYEVWITLHNSNQELFILTHCKYAPCILSVDKAAEKGFISVFLELELRSTREPVPDWPLISFNWWTLFLVIHCTIVWYSHIDGSC